MKRFLDYINEIKSPNLKKARERHDQERLDLKKRQATEILRAQEKDIDSSRREQEKKVRARAAQTSENVELNIEENRDKDELPKKEPPPEIGTDDIVKRYKKFIPNQ
jgi:hypothetical protein